MKTNIIELSDGRKKAYNIYGEPNGEPLFLLHGTPGSRVWFLEDDLIAKELGICLIATDRPGFGLSDKKESRTLLDYAKDIEELANHLKLDKFSVMGVSGGGAYTAAIAYALPNRVKKAVLVSTATPFENGKPPKDMSKVNKFAFFLTKKAPWLLKKMDGLNKKMIDENPQKYKGMMKKGGKHLSNWDNVMMKKGEVQENTIIHAKEAYRQGVEEVANESRLLTKEWGFNLEDIEVPIVIWHGEEDTLSPISAVKEMAKRIKNKKEVYIDHGGHFLTEQEDVWRNILYSAIEK